MRVRNLIVVAALSVALAPSAQAEGVGANVAGLSGAVAGSSLLHGTPVTQLLDTFELPAVDRQKVDELLGGGGGRSGDAPTTTPPFMVTGKCTYQVTGVVPNPPPGGAPHFVVEVAGSAVSGAYPAAATIVRCTISNANDSWTTVGASFFNTGSTAGVFLVPVADSIQKLCIDAAAIPQPLPMEPPPAAFSACTTLQITP